MRGRLLLALGAVSCSFGMIEAPSPLPAHGPIECSDSKAAPVADTFGVVAGVLVGVVAGLAEYVDQVRNGEGDPPVPMDRGKVVTYGLVIGGLPTAAYALSAVMGYHLRARCIDARAELAAREDAARKEAARSAREGARAHDDARDRAWSLTKAAALRARDGDCARVVELDAEVHALDTDFHDAVFVRDVAIARCLSADLRR